MCAGQLRPRRRSVVVWIVGLAKVLVVAGAHNRQCQQCTLWRMESTPRRKCEVDSALECCTLPIELSDGVKCVLKRVAASFCVWTQRLKRDRAEFAPENGSIGYYRVREHYRRMSFGLAHGSKTKRQFRMLSSEQIGFHSIVGSATENACAAHNLLAAGTQARGYRLCHRIYPLRA